MPVSLHVHILLLLLLCIRNPARFGVTHQRTCKAHVAFAYTAAMPCLAGRLHIRCMTHVCLAPQISAPLAVIGGHTKAVSYVRWVGSNQVISASTDNTLKLWDVADAAQSEGNCAPITSFTGRLYTSDHAAPAVHFCYCYCYVAVSAMCLHLA